MNPDRRFHLNPDHRIFGIKLKCMFSYVLLLFFILQWTGPSFFTHHLDQRSLLTHSANNTAGHPSFHESLLTFQRPFETIPSAFLQVVFEENILEEDDDFNSFGELILLHLIGVKYIPVLIDSGIYVLTDLQEAVPFFILYHSWKIYLS